MISPEQRIYNLEQENAKLQQDFYGMEISYRVQLKNAEEVIARLREDLEYAETALESLEKS